MATKTSTTKNTTTSTKAATQTAPKTITQGQNVSGGIAQYNPQTGARLSKGETVDTKTGKSVGSTPKVSYGEEVIDPSTGASVGKAMFDPDTGESLQPQQKVPTFPQMQPVQQAPVEPTIPQGQVATAGTPAEVAQRMKQGFSQTQMSGVSAPASMGEAKSTIQKSLPPAAPDTAIVDTALQEDTVFKGILDNFAELMKPPKQTESLLGEYKRMVKTSGLDEINEELIDTQRIIEGTEDDIRAEVTAAQGFATDSQILAMASSRNKSLIKNYNALLATRDSIKEQLNTMISLSQQDKQMAQEKMNQQLNLGFKILDYRDKMQSGAKEGYNNVIRAMGYAGLYSSLANNPYELSLAEKTMGLAPGQLAQLAANDTSQEERKLDLQLKKEQIASARRSNRDTGVDTQVVDIGGKKMLINSQTGETIKEIGQDSPTSSALVGIQDTVNNIDSLLQSKGIRSAVGSTVFNRGGTFKPGRVQDFIAGIETLTSQLALDSLVSAKERGATFGALSDAELKILAASGTKLGSWAIKDKNGNVTGYKASEKSFKQELDRINNFSKRDFILKGGDPIQIGVQTLPDGTMWSINSDGSMTQIM